MNKAFYVFAIICLNLVFTQSLLSQVNDYNWFYDLKKTTTDAQENDKNILMVFSGSDWCRPCMKFKIDVLTKDAFLEFSTKQLNILYLDFPAKKKNKLSKEQLKHNEDLAALYNRSGSFPKIVLLDQDANLISELSYRGQSAEEFISLIKTKMNKND